MALQVMPLKVSRLIDFEDVLPSCAPATASGIKFETEMEWSESIAKALSQAFVDNKELFGQLIKPESATFPIVSPELGQIGDELEDNVVLPFPPAQKYTVDLTVTKITRWKLKLAITEDLL